MVWILNGIWNPEAWPFEIQTKGQLLAVVLSKPFEILTKMYFEWSTFQVDLSYSYIYSATLWKTDHLKNRPFEIWSSISPDFERWDFRSPLYCQKYRLLVNQVHRGIPFEYDGCTPESADGSLTRYQKWAGNDARPARPVRSDVRRNGTRLRWTRAVSSRIPQC